LKRHTFGVFLLSVGVVAGPVGTVHATDTSLGRLLDQWSAQAGRPGDAGRGEAFFVSRHGGRWSCASCHGAPPTRPGRHDGTGRALDPLAPGFNPKAFTDTARVDKWFRRNCRDVLARECSAAEKSDVLAYLDGLGQAGGSGTPPR
jgi:hypothetical protein